MKVAFTFILITFAITGVMYLAGLDTAHYSAFGLLNDIITKGIFDSSGFWAIVLGFVLVVGGVSTVNILTGGNASVGITAGYISLIATYFFGLLNDFRSIIVNVAGKCSLDVMLSCDWIYPVFWLIGGLLIVGMIWSMIDLIGGND